MPSSFKHLQRPAREPAVRSDEESGNPLRFVRHCETRRAAARSTHHVVRRPARARHLRRAGRHARRRCRGRRGRWRLQAVPSPARRGQPRRPGKHRSAGCHRTGRHRSRDAAVIAGRYWGRYCTNLTNHASHDGPPWGARFFNRPCSARAKTRQETQSSCCSAPLQYCTV